MGLGYSVFRGFVSQSNVIQVYRGLMSFSVSDDDTVLLFGQFNNNKLQKLHFCCIKGHEHQEESDKQSFTQN